MSDDDAIEPADGDVLEVLIPSSLAAIRVDRVLSFLTGVSRSEAVAMLASGGVALDERVVLKPSTLVEEGQRLVAIVPRADSAALEPEPEVSVDVVIDDADFVVVDKAPGQVVHPGAGQRRGTLVAGLLARYPELRALRDEGLCDPQRPGVVHRLDKGTSGLLVVAKTPEGYLSLRDQIATRQMERVYVGLVEGHVAEERGVIDAPIGRSLRAPTLMEVRADGRPARTAYEVIARYERPSAVTLLRLRLETGRTHQIRVHVAAIAHPIVNDPRYGHRPDRRLAEGRFFLHSATLAFAHPRSGQRVKATAKLPADLAELVPGADL